MIAAAVYLNIVFCTNEARTNCMPPQFMWTAAEFMPIAERAAKCQGNAALMNQVQADKSMYYRCDAVKGENQ